MIKEIILSGIQPTGKLHIGNYLGALKNFVALQDQHECYFFIADYHSITENYEPNTKPQQVMELATDFLAAGLNPKKCTIFVQSHVAEHTELAWIFNCVTPISYLERMTQYKDKANQQQKNINVGLFDYPVLQAADILMYRVTAVPVGQDQDQHVELTRQIARFFNNRFGQTFTEPKTIHTDTPKVMSLLTPEKKMSKSLGDNHCLYIDDEPKVIAAKLAKAVTDTGDGQGLGARNLLDLIKIFSDDKTYKRFQAEKNSGTLKYSELKEILAQDIADYFADFRKRKKQISQKEVEKTLADGAKKAQAIAQKTMAEVRIKIGIR
ncbi:MAG: tryptophan--tRNA ligase [Candidatus Buchananbacteria bacterium RIFCSPHIGHO2_01_FULL_44_11]|uniref:Tryptophan--tRNA ligase n=1 Tax=Candidatus Buchananbacteria bacterium RIFCSPHIGHO2_01_FULL_44_11 TaxID=1797535 RepID=A0A1G1XYS2_9BACT|nr:MAG: tryptophan--tRNA ligase [Candidatus Buchananbacteria bacterium RIFCSPHIGHO2_01_FULL_44_11]